MTRQSSNKHRKAPPPPSARAVKPRPAPKPRLPMCKALYAYEPQEADELTFAEGDMIEIVNEGTIHFVFISFRLVCLPKSFGFYDYFPFTPCVKLKNVHTNSIQIQILIFQLSCNLQIHQAGGLANSEAKKAYSLLTMSKKSNNILLLFTLYFNLYINKNYCLFSISPSSMMFILESYEENLLLIFLLTPQTNILIYFTYSFSI